LVLTLALFPRPAAFVATLHPVIATLWSIELTKKHLTRHPLFHRF